MTVSLTKHKTYTYLGYSTFVFRREYFFSLTSKNREIRSWWGTVWKWSWWPIHEM